jgi:hypothetical protein
MKESRPWTTLLVELALAVDHGAAPTKQKVGMQGMAVATM